VAKIKEINVYKHLIIIAIVVSLSATPFLNKDALIIPKLIVIFSGSMYLFSFLIQRLKTIKLSKFEFMFCMIVVLIFIHLILVLTLSTSPLEQQIYGRTGRGLGLLTWISYLIILLVSYFFASKEKLDLFFQGITFSVVMVSSYSILQSYGLDFFPWDSRTNGVIGTFGNPNFVSSFIAMALVPTVLYFNEKKSKKFYQYSVVAILLFTIFRAQSTQGYIGVALSVTIYYLCKLWIRNKKLFFLALMVAIATIYILVRSMLNEGPFSKYLYKVSIISRGDFWRSAYSTASDFKFFGVGLDSFGDYYLKYRDYKAANRSFAEYTDSAHNYFLDFLVSGGYPLAILNLSLCFLGLFVFINFMRNSKSFDSKFVALICSYIVFIAQALISPISIPIFLWSAIILGSAIKIYVDNKNELEQKNNNLRIQNVPIVLRLILPIISILIWLPLFNADRLQLQAMKSSNGDLAIESAKLFPESVIRYSAIIRGLLNSGLNNQALVLTRKAVNFNPNSPSLWILFLINPDSTKEDFELAKQKMRDLDPLNTFLWENNFPEKME
jgi:O-antigen ligase